MFSSAALAKAYLTAGNAVMTVVSQKTGARYTYRVRASKDGAVHFVAVLTGPSNENDYQFIGVIRDDEFRTSPKARVSDTAPSFVVFAFVWGHLVRGWIHPMVELHHNGTCGRCGRMLTTPESIATGLGPVCSEKE